MSTPTAYVQLRDKAHYRKEAFINGLSRLGFIVQQGIPEKPLEPNDVAVIWNKTLRSRSAVEMAKIGGGAVIVAENGYYGVDKQGIQTYAMALDGHNGSGRWYAPDDSRLKALNIDFKPFRPLDGTKVVIAGQRGIGSALMKSPHHFEEATQAILRRNHFDVQVRPHPGTAPPTTTVIEDLKGARCLVVWSSNCATTALINGVPTYFCAPTIASEGASLRFKPDLNLAPTVEGREEAFKRMAWAQWFLSEIGSGEAFQTLIDVHHGRLPSCKPGYGL